MNKKMTFLAFGAKWGIRGSIGPAAARPAYDTVAQAASGFLKLLINPANPRVVGPALADAITGFYAAYGILGALYERERQRADGDGHVVEDAEPRAAVRTCVVRAAGHVARDAAIEREAAREQGPRRRQERAAGDGGGAGQADQAFLVAA